jgi:hypothetical protein
MTREKPVGQRLFTRDVWPVVPPLLGVLAGLAILATGGWRLGLLVIGAAVGGGGLLRLFLPPRTAGLLAVRGRAFDTAVMLLLGAAIVAVALLR